jgi:hypothetical protein
MIKKFAIIQGITVVLIIDAPHEFDVSLFEYQQSGYGYIDVTNIEGVQVGSTYNHNEWNY